MSQDPRRRCRFRLSLGRPPGPAAVGELSFERLRRDANDLIDALRHRLGVTRRRIRKHGVGACNAQLQGSRSGNETAKDHVPLWRSG
jgi:hypothetical protein